MGHLPLRHYLYCAAPNRCSLPQPILSRGWMTLIWEFITEILYVNLMHFVIKDTAFIGIFWGSSSLLRSAVGMTHSLRSDLWWTIPFRFLLGQFWDTSEIDHTYLSIEAQCVSHHYPQWTATISPCFDKATQLIKTLNHKLLIGTLLYGIWYPARCLIVNSCNWHSLRQAWRSLCKEDVSQL